MLRKLLLIPFGVLVGLVLSIALLKLYRCIRPQPRPIATAEQPAVKALLDENPKSNYCFDEQTSYRLKPSFRGVRADSPETKPWVHETNRLGLLGTDEPSRDPRVKKVLFLGDSVCYGDGVPIESTFVYRMQQQAGSGYQLLNAACPGYSTNQEVALFNRACKTSIGCSDHCLLPERPGPLRVGLRRCQWRLQDVGGDTRRGRAIRVRPTRPKP